MSQRITLIMSAVTTVVCLVAFGMVWHVAEESRTANAALIQQAQSANQALVRKLAEFSRSVNGASTDTLKWTKTRFRLVSGKPGGPAVENAQIKLDGLSTDDMTKSVDLTESTNAEGIAEFGLVPVGAYNYLLTMPWGERCREYFYLRPGHDDTHDIVCPTPLKDSKLSFSVNWPEDLREGEENLFIYGSISANTRSIDSRKWENPKSHNSLLISSTGEIYTSISTPHEVGYRVRLDLYGSDTKKASLRIPQGSYRLSHIRVVSRIEPLKPDGSETWFANLLSPDHPKPDRRYGRWSETLDVIAEKDKRWTLTVPNHLREQLRTAIRREDSSTD